MKHTVCCNGRLGTAGAAPGSYTVAHSAGVSGCTYDGTWLRGLPQGTAMVSGVDLDGDTVLYFMGGHTMFLVYDPWAGRYALADGGKRMAVSPWNYVQVVKSDRLRYIYLVVSKCGCSCMLSSALHYDKRIDVDGFVWRNAPYDHSTGDALCSYSGVRAMRVVQDPEYAGYRRFTAVQDETERYCRFLNWTLKNRYNNYLDMSLPRTGYLMESLHLYPYFTRDMFSCDQHAVSQDMHFRYAASQLYGGDMDRFKSEFEPVPLASLGAWFEDAFGVPMVANNMDSAEEERYTPDNLSDDERAAVEEVVKPMETFKL